MYGARRLRTIRASPGSPYSFHNLVPNGPIANAASKEFGRKRKGFRTSSATLKLPSA
jgi:hypothetical protein